MSTDNRPQPKRCKHCGALVAARLMGVFNQGKPNERPLYFQVHRCPVLAKKAANPFANVMGGPFQ